MVVPWYFTNREKERKKGANEKTDKMINCWSGGRGGRGVQQRVGVKSSILIDMWTISTAHLSWTNIYFNLEAVY